MTIHGPRLIAVAAVAVFLAGCGGAGKSGDSAAAGGGKELKVGVLAPLSGAGQGFGVGLATAAEIVADEFNAKGGLTLDGTKYNLVIEKYDDKYVAEGTLAGYNKLITKEGIKILIGPITSAGGIAIKSKIESDKLISMGDTYTPKIFDKNTKYYFRINATSGEIAPAIWRYFIKQSPGLTKLAVIGPDDATGTAGNGLSLAAAKAAGLTEVNNSAVARGTPDFSAAVTSLLQSHPDVIDLSTLPSQDAGLIIKTARQLGYTGPFVKTGGASPAEITAVSGQANAQGLLFAQQCDLSNSKVQEYQRKYKEKTSVPFDALSCEWHDTITMGFTALEKAGSLDADKYVTAMQNAAPFEGPLKGTLRWGGEQTYGVKHQILGKLWLYQFKGDVSTAVGTIEEESP